MGRASLELRCFAQTHLGVSPPGDLCVGRRLAAVGLATLQAGRLLWDEGLGSSCRGRGLACAQRGLSSVGSAATARGPLAPRDLPRALPLCAGARPRPLHPCARASPGASQAVTVLSSRRAAPPRVSSRHRPSPAPASPSLRLPPPAPGPYSSPEAHHQHHGKDDSPKPLALERTWDKGGRQVSLGWA